MTVASRGTPVAEELDLLVPAGRIHAQRFGSPAAPLVLALPGLSANLRSFDLIGAGIGADLQLVAVDLRGRGRSEITQPGTYGWINHARDVLAIADQLGMQRFSLIGHSMGGAVAMSTAFLDAARIERLVLIDICGAPDPATAAPIGAAVSRLGAVYPSTEAFIALVRQIGTIQPWNELWDGYFGYELVEVEGGVASRTDRQAVLEDAAFGMGAFAFGEDSGVYALWRHLSMPTLLLRAARELLPGFGHIVSASDRDRFTREVATATLVEIDANHYGIAAHPATPEAISAFLHEP